MSAMTLEELMPTRMPCEVFFPRNGEPVPVAEVVTWLRTGCPKIHHLHAAALEKVFETVAFQPFPNGEAMAVVGMTRPAHGHFRIPVCVMTPHENPELAAVGELLRTEARVRNPGIGGYITYPAKKK